MLKVNRKNREPSGRHFRLILSTRKAQELEEVPAVFLPKAIVAEQRIEEVVFFGIHVRIQNVRKERRQPESGFRVPALPVKERTKRFGSLARIEC